MRNIFRPAGKTSFLLFLILISPLLVHAEARERTLYEFGGNCWVDQQNYNLISSLVADSKGNLYGTRYCSPMPGNGFVFQLQRNSQGSLDYKIIYVFGRRNEGVWPFGGLSVDSAGNLYGVTYEGGAYNGGVVYELSPDTSGSWHETVLWNFPSYPSKGDGCNPYAAPILDEVGNLYGTTTACGAYYGGAAFELMRNSNGDWSETILHNFASRLGPDGAAPNSNLVFDKSGNLYGTTPMGGQYTYGTVFELSRGYDNTWAETLLHQFTGGVDGSSPYGVVFDADGNLYGSNDGPLNTYTGGIVYALTPQPDATWSETVLYTFPAWTNTLIGGPGVLSFSQKGDLYGPAGFGGPSNGGCPQGCGGIFRLVPGLGSRWIYQQIYGFTGLADGGVPMGPLVFDGKGNIYDTNNYGGTAAEGTVFQILVQ